jgi:uracil-DNA glycosylase
MHDPAVPSPGPSAAFPPGGPLVSGKDLAAAVAACRVCVEAPSGRSLPHAPRPVLRLGSGTARLVIAGQAPGTRVHASGTPFDDPSGVRLREWLGLDAATFYDADRVAIVPMGFCFPGLDSKGSDLPPRPECARTWHARVFALLPRPLLLVALGRHAQAWHLRRLGRPDLLGPTLGATVANWRAILDGTGVLPLPHPSWRNSGWLKRNPWFAAEVLPVLRGRVRQAVAGGALGGERP